jgi:predicted MFS family arabinose efflux permease
MLAAWFPIACLSYSLWFLVVGVILLDLAVQAVHVTNQTLIVAARPEAHSRLIGGYMVFYSIGTACGSIASTMVYAKAGWTGVCVLGAIVSAGALLFWFATVRQATAGGSYGCAELAPCKTGGT